MSIISEYLDDTLEKCGGFGRFQFLVIGSIFLGEISVAWSILMMTFGGAIPEWSCDKWSNGTYTTSENTTLKTCVAPSNYSSFDCVHKVFDKSLHTVVNEWELVCDDDKITQSITTIQMGGLLVGCIFAGQIGDLYGRKLTYFISLLVLLVSNGVAAFSVNWQMFAVLRFFIGCGCGIYLTVHLTFKVEFISGKYRPILLGLPVWAVFASSYGGLSYLLHDWMYLQIATAAVNAPLLLTWWLIPESFRWLVANDRLEEARNVIKKIAKMNGNPVPDTSKLEAIAASGHSEHINFTYMDICKNEELLKKTILLAIAWITCGYVYYAISFGVQQLSGSLYLNMFLLSIVEVPSLLVGWFFNHCIGRRWTTIIFFVFVAVTGTIVGGVQLTDLEWKGGLINGFALASKLGVGAGWASLMLLSSESYPTVVRNLGYGIQNTVARIGAMVAPQIVYLSQHVTGVMYFLCGGLMLLSALSIFCVPDTKDQGLADTIDLKKHNRSTEIGTKNSGKYNEAFSMDDTSSRL